ncbi:hypothetical protein [Maribacter sp. 2304DJ31-5]|uniref:hypothetical protein n=1 Tax=Maribacter sp. 2304DJ31-5 TaxID=3386273 RepID=UPI0039BCAB42
MEIFFRNSIIGVKRDGQKWIYKPIYQVGLLTFVLWTVAPQLKAQNKPPFQMPSSHNEGAIYDTIDFYNFSTVAFDSQNRPYGFNIHEEFGYVRTLRNGIWVMHNYLDDLKVKHPGSSITNAHTTNGHHHPRVSITSDDHMYITLDYLVDSEKQWAILYLDNLDSDNFQVETFTGVQMMNVEEFTGHNLKNGETPGILITERDESLAELGWPTRTVTWSINAVSIVKLLIPYRNSNGTVSFNTTTIGSRLGATTIHSGGDATMATTGNRTYLTYSGFDEDKIMNKGARDNVNRGYLAEVIRPSSVSGNATVTSRFMGVQSVYGHIDSHSQGGIVLDAVGKLHYLSGNHAASDEYWRSDYGIADPSFDFMNGWSQYGKTTLNGDFSYDTPVIDNNNILHVAYRQRNAGANRGLYVKTASVTTTDWGTGLGDLIVRPPTPWNTNGQYIVLYHRLIMDRAGNVHLSSGFFEFVNYKNGAYPRINAFRPHGNGIWAMPDRYTYLENSTNGKTVQRISFSMDDQHLENSPVTLNASTDATELSVYYEVVSGPATVDGNILRLIGIGEVTVIAKNLGNVNYYGDEVIQTFQVK